MKRVRHARKNVWSRMLGRPKASIANIWIPLYDLLMYVKDISGEAMNKKAGQGKLSGLMKGVDGAEA